MDEVKTIQAGLGCKKSHVNLTRLNKKDLDKDDLQLLKSPIVTALDEANKVLTKKHAALEDKSKDKETLEIIVENEAIAELTKVERNDLEDTVQEK